MEVRSPSEDDNLTICLGLPIGDGNCKLLVYVGDNDFVHEIVVIDTLQPSPTFFAVLFGAVHGLIIYPINVDIDTLVEPMKNLKLKLLVCTKHNRVFCSLDEKTVYKMYTRRYIPGYPILI